MRTPSSGRWFPGGTRPASRLRLFCLPFGGGSAAAYSPWATDFPAEIGLVPVELPGHGTRLREPPQRSLEEVVAGLVEALGPLLTQPFAFFGHSMGALLAFETARALRQANLPAPRRLILSGQPAPHFPTDEEPAADLDDDAFLGYLRRLGGTPPEVLGNRRLMELLLPAIRADFRLVESYRHAPQPPLDIPCSVYGGLQDPLATREELAAWQAHTARPVTIRMFQGSHFFLTQAPDLVIRALLTDLLSDLA
jgi:medium-chain acyl-[acyl-carrier-protein] hydrolase